jgi:hypothetical protein
VAKETIIFYTCDFDTEKSHEAHFSCRSASGSTFDTCGKHFKILVLRGLATGNPVTITSLKATEQETEDLTCPECGRSYASLLALSMHRRKTHGIPGRTSKQHLQPRKASQ